MPEVIDLPLPPTAFLRLYVPPDEPPAALGQCDERRYLVLLSTVAGDLPVGLFEHATEAVDHAREVNGNPDAHAQRYFDAVARPDDCRSCLWLDVSVVEFHGPQPHKRTILFHLD